jgi:hypothetical protein
MKFLRVTGGLKAIVASLCDSEHLQGNKRHPRGDRVVEKSLSPFTAAVLSAIGFFRLQIIHLRNRFTAQIGRTARFQIAQIRIIEIIAYSISGQTMRPLPCRGGSRNLTFMGSRSRFVYFHACRKD